MGERISPRRTVAFASGVSLLAAFGGVLQSQMVVSKVLWKEGGLPWDPAIENPEDPYSIFTFIQVASYFLAFLSGLFGIAAGMTRKMHFATIYLRCITFAVLFCASAPTFPLMLMFDRYVEIQKALWGIEGLVFFWLFVAGSTIVFALAMRDAYRLREAIRDIRRQLLMAARESGGDWIPLISGAKSHGSFYDHGDKVASTEMSIEDASDFGLFAQVPSPEKTANIFSRLFFWWVNDLIAQGYKTPLEMTNIYQLLDTDRTYEVSANFEACWQRELSKAALAGRPPSLIRTLHHAFGFKFYIAGVIKILHDALSFAGPIILARIIEWLGDPLQPGWLGFVLVAVLFSAMMIQTVMINVYFNMVMRVGMNVRCAMIAAVYRKALRMSGEGRRKYATGDIVNMMNNDSNRLMMLMSYLHIAWSAPAQMIVCLVLLFTSLGWTTVIGVAVMVLYIPIQGVITKKLMRFSKAIIGITDKRVRLMNEILNGIRVIKFFAWEPNFSDRIGAIREQEMQQLKKQAWWRVAFGVMMTTSTVMVSVVCFAVYAAVNTELSAAIIFPALTLFNMLRFPMMMLPNVINSCVDAKVSLDRLCKYLLVEEVVPRQHLRNGLTPPPGGAQVRNGTFYWEDITRPTLSNVNVTIPPRKLTMIIGKVGSGKSSLLSALLGEIRGTPGSGVAVEGRIAYVAQQAWIINATVKNNIIFTRNLDEARYRETIAACALTTDLEMLPASDQTEIGEKGINLSGGQKQRVSIARSVYANAEVYLFDDPLSAVDAHVGKHIFRECIHGMLREKTVVLVTHQLQFLRFADQVIVMDGGKVVNTGTYDELVAAGMDFNQFINPEQEAAEAEKAEAEKAEKEKDAGKKKPAAAAPKAASGASGKLVSVEEREKGVVQWKVYAFYIQAAGGLAMALTLLTLFISGQATSSGTDVWLSLWSGQEIPDQGLVFYISIYFGMAVATAVFAFISGVLAIGVGGVKASRALHHQVFNRVVRAPMAFFDTVPMGRILNRFSKDTSSVDGEIPGTLPQLIRSALTLVAAMAVISWVTPLFLIPLTPIMMLYLFIQAYYRHTSRELKRLDSLSRSPVFSHFSETLSGTETIRAYSLTERFAENSAALTDTNNRAYWMMSIANRWLSIRMELCGALVVAFAALLAVVGKGGLDPARAGLSISYALQITGYLTWAVRMFAEAEAQMNAVERIREYCEIEQEPAAERAQDNSIVPLGWPARGAIEFQKVVFRYRPNLPPVLNGASFSINPGEKVGVVGRTGAGKSSLIVAMFRLAELSSGRVLVDGVDISQLGLRKLRSALSIIPQDPVLFSGTVRTNIDPFSEHPDESIWHALERCHMAAAVRALPEGINAPVSENGANFSVGQRQLFCMGRALLRNSRILFMDEATAAVDVDTDALIQRTVREAFADRTVVTIAHRLDTILDNDRILVMSAGEVAEFGAPATLVDDPKSFLSKMVDDTGAHYAQYLRQLARREVDMFSQDQKPRSVFG